MKLYLKGFKKVIQNKSIVFCIATVMLAPLCSHAQSDRESVDDEPAVETSTNSGPWGNSAGSAIGSNGNATTQGTARPNDPNLSSASSAARPLAGPTPDATGGPGGNPDVPFDTNMNLLFLAGGVAFAYIVYRRRLKPVTVAKK
jgi:hypothetical protein